MKAFLSIVLLAALAAPAGAATRILFSNYAPDSGAVRLHVDGQPVTGPVGYSETDDRYRLVESGERALTLIAPGRGVVASRSVILPPGDYSAFFYTQTDGTPAIEIARDALAGFDFSVPAEFETNDGNAAFRFLSFAQFPAEGPLAVIGTGTQMFRLSDGSMFQGGVFEVEKRLDAFGEAVIVGASAANVNSIASEIIVLEAGVATTASGSVELAEVLVRGEFTLPVDTTDYVIIGGPESLQVIERPRPGNRSATVDGLYGERGINGSGIQLYELPEIGRVYGLLYTYRDDGSPVWYYLDSRCDLDRGFACTIPGLLVASGGYVAAVYEASGGALAAGAEADLHAVGSALVRGPWAGMEGIVKRTPGAFLENEEPPSVELILKLEPPSLDMPQTFSDPDAIFFFDRIAR